METPNISDLPRHLADRGRTIWVDLEEPSDEETGILGGIFGFHVLAIEECLRSEVLPKLDEYDGYSFLIFHTPGDSRDPTDSKEVAIFVGANYLVTFHASHVKGLSDGRGQVAKNPGSLLRSPDWLLVGLLQAMVEPFGEVLGNLRARLEKVEASLDDGSLQAGEILRLRKGVFHLGRISTLETTYLDRFARAEPTWLSVDNAVYFRSIRNRVERIGQVCEGYRETLSGLGDALKLRDLAFTSSWNRSLAIVAVVVLPSLLLTGIYAMKFSTIPGLGQEHGSLAVIGFVIAAIVAGLAFFRKKRRI